MGEFRWNGPVLGCSQASRLAITMHRPGALSDTSYGLSGPRSGSAVRGELPTPTPFPLCYSEGTHREQRLLCCLGALITCLPPTLWWPN